MSKTKDSPKLVHYEILPNGSKAPIIDIGPAPDFDQPENVGFGNWQDIKTFTKFYDPHDGDPGYVRDVIAKGYWIKLVWADKGGTGKTAFCYGLVELLLRLGYKVVLVEADETNPDSSTPYENDPRVRVEKFNLRAPDGIAKLVDMLEVNRPPMVVVNGAAALNQPIGTDGDLLNDAVANFGYNMRVFWVMNTQDQTLHMLDRFWSIMTNAKYHAVLNLKEAARRTVGEFEDYINSNIRHRIEAQGRTLVMPLGPTEAFNRAEKEGISLSTQEADERILLSQRSFIAKWRRLMGVQFSRIMN